LVVELDGGTHDDPAHAKRDALRTQALAKLAITVVRLPNDQVSENVLRQLLTPHAQPSQGREHGSGP
jgi:very-short-patch-repair endonuclease